MLTKKLFKVYILGNNTKKSQVIADLQEKGILHIVESDYKSEEFIKDKSLPGTEDLSLISLKLKTLIEQTNIKEELKIKSVPALKTTKKEAENILKKYYDKVQKQIASKNKLKEKIKSVTSKLNSIKNLPFHFTVPKTKNIATQLYLSNSRDNFDFGSLNTKLIVNKITHKKVIYYKISTLKQNLKKLTEALKTSSLKKIDISFVSDSTQSTIVSLENEINNISKQIEVINEQIHSLVVKDKKKILFTFLAVKNHLNSLTIANLFQVSKKHFLVKGFVEKDNLGELKKLKEVTIFYDEPGEGAPTKLNNKGFSKNFEDLTKLYSLPKYGAIDPTSLISFFYPLFFGLMLSDVGYGILTLILGLFLSVKYNIKKQITSIILISSISAILFGFMFGSFFGELISIPAILGSSFELSYRILIASLIIGLIHMNLGIILNAYQKFSGKFNIKDIIEVTKYPLIQVIIILFVFNLNTLAFLFLGLLLAMVLYDKKLLGLMDITGFFGTWFSYARILALNLATAGVALAVNILASKTLEIQTWGVLLFVLIILLGHLFNLVVSLIGCSINAARLHYVEFFGQFFKSGGIPYKVFSLKKELKLT